MQFSTNILSKQECIPVGCIPPAAVAVCWGAVYLSAYWDNHPSGVGLEIPLGVGPETPLGVGLETPLDVGLETPQARPLNLPPGCGPGDPPGLTPQLPPGCRPGNPPRPDPSNSPLGVGLETCNACWDTTPPWTETCNACWDTNPPLPPVNRIRDTYKNNLAPTSLRAVIIGCRPKLRVGAPREFPDPPLNSSHKTNGSRW